MNMFSHSRRQMLEMVRVAGCGLLGQSCIRAAQARAAATGAPSNLFDIQRVADSVYAAIARPAAIINCNAVIFENRKDLLIVDAHSKPSAAASLVAQVRREVSRKPVRYLVNSHFHWDHIQGMPAYAKLAPDADVVASRVTRDVIEREAIERLAASLKSSRAKLERSLKAAESARSPAEKSFYERFTGEIKAYLAEMEGWTPDLPNITFDDHLVIHDPEHELHLVFKGRAHTGGDICVHCPQKRVIATADVVSGFIPGMYDGYPLEWPATLNRIAELEFDRLIPGHGDVQETKKHLLQECSYIEEVIAAVRKGKSQGRSVGDLQEEVKLERLHTITGSDYGAFVELSVRSHMLSPPGTHARDIMANSVRTNVANIYAAIG